MAEVLDILDAFTLPLKMAWVIWLAWGIGQVFWYRYERTPRAVSATRPAPMRKAFVSKPSMPERAATRLITPDVMPPPQRKVEPPAPAALAPAFVEEPSGIGPVAELDQFVADFEMHTRHRRGEPVNGEHSPFASQFDEAEFDNADRMP
jgi:hypothetical protein